MPCCARSRWHRPPGLCSATGCLRGTRLPVTALFEHLDQGSTIDKFWSGLRPSPANRCIPFLPLPRVPWAACGGCVKILCCVTPTRRRRAPISSGDMTVVRADQLEWQELENGELLNAAEEAGFDLLLTCDQNVRYQQNFKSRKLALVILSANHRLTLRGVAARIARAVDFVQAGQIVRSTSRRCSPAHSFTLSVPGFNLPFVARQRPGGRSRRRWVRISRRGVRRGWTRMRCRGRIGGYPARQPDSAVIVIEDHLPPERP